MRRESKSEYTPPPVPPQYRKEVVFGATQSRHSQQQPEIDPADKPDKPPSTAHLEGGWLRLRTLSRQLSLGRVIPVALVVSLVLVSWWGEHKFNTMTPAQHVAAAKQALEQGNIDDGLRHIGAVPPRSPEALQAREVADQLNAALEVARQRQAALVQAQNAQLAAVLQLQRQLKDLGYDLTVTRSEQKPEEIIISSEEFSDSDHRVRFLAFIKGRNSPGLGACFEGFRFVRLQTVPLFHTPRPLFGFSESYPLDCFSPP